MIVLMVGLMGSGKSYEAVNYRIIPALRAGRRVITNIPLNVDYIVSVIGEEVRELIVILEPREDENGDIVDVPFSSMEHLKDDWKHPVKKFGALFVIDEAQIPMPAQQTEFNKWALKYATMQRHRGHDWVLISQDPSLIYQPLVKLAITTHHYQKCTNVGRMDQYRHFVLDGSGAKTDFILEKTTKKYDPKKFKFYKSHTESDGEVQEQNITGAFFNLKGLLYSLAFFILVVIGAIIWFFVSYIPSRYKVEDTIEYSQELDSGISSNTESLILNVDNEALSLPAYVPVYTPKIAYKNVEEPDKSTETISISSVVRSVVVRDPIHSVDELKLAPYYNFQFHIIGNIVFHKSTSDVFYGVWSAQGVQEQISRKDLINMGYTITILNKCTHLFDHKYLREPFYVTCHTPLFEDQKDKKKDEKQDPNKSMTETAADKLTAGVSS